MYGIINQAVKDLVVSRFGETKWTEICVLSKIENTDFISLHPYPDAMTYSLVHSVSQVLKTPAEDVLKEFGRYWILYTGKEGYGPLMDLFGNNFIECLENLNNLHSRMGMTMPSLYPPHFVLRTIKENYYEVQYISKRAGLCPMVIGLLEGLAEKFNLKTEIKLVEHETNKIFQIQVLGR